MTDTEQPSGVTTDGDSEAPVSTPVAPVLPSPPANAPVQLLVQNMQITFTGITDDMSSFEQQEWEMLTEDWFDDFYNNNNGRRLQAGTPGVGDNYGVVAGSMTNAVQVTQTTFDDSSNGGTLMVVYNHEYAYEAKESAFGPLQYATLPFRSTQAIAAYSAQLQQSIEPFAAVDTPVPVPKIGGPGISTDSDDDGLSGGAIAGICCGGLIVVGALAFGGYSRKTAVEKRNAAAVHSSQEIGREAFAFDAGFDESSPEGSNLLYAASSQGYVRLVVCTGMSIIGDLLILSCFLFHSHLTFSVAHLSGSLRLEPNRLYRMIPKSCTLCSRPKASWALCSTIPTRMDLSCTLSKMIRLYSTRWRLGTG